MRYPLRMKLLSCKGWGCHHRRQPSSPRALNLRQPGLTCKYGGRSSYGDVLGRFALLLRLAGAVNTLAVPLPVAAGFPSIKTPLGRQLQLSGRSSA